MKTRTYTILGIAAVMFSLTSCKKQKAENGLEGNWTVNSSESRSLSGTDHPLVSPALDSLFCSSEVVLSGDIIIDEDGNGFATIYGTYCDTTFIVFDKGISDLHIIDHDADPDFLNGQIVHWYQGYFNTDIYFDCKSLSDKGKINKKTPEISFNISGLIDQTTGGYVEEYALQLVLTRND